MWTPNFRPDFGKLQNCVFFILQVITHFDVFWRLKDGVNLFLVFFQKNINPKYLPEQRIRFETSELNWTRHFLVFLTIHDTEGGEQCFFVVHEISPCFCDWFSVIFGIPKLWALDFCHALSYKLLKNGLFFSSSELKIFVKK